MMNPAISEMRCRERIQETHDTATFLFDAKGVAYKPGQFTTVQVEIDGVVQQRAYTLSSTPSRPGSMAVTIKRVDGGVVSNHLLDTLAPGMNLALSDPAGAFNLADCTQSEHYVFVSAGSGITPMMSMTRYLLDTGSQASIHFVYFARSSKDLIFGDELNLLTETHANLTLDIVLSDTSEAGYHSGLLDQDLFQKLVPELTGRAVYTCGPAPFMALLETCLERRGFDMSRYHMESFGQVPASSETANLNESDTSADVVTVEVPGFGKSATVAPESSLLEAAEQMQLPIIGACRSGVCGSCKCKVVKGDVESNSQMTLTPEEIEAGVVLACSSKVLSDVEIALP
ncbi:hybrid-cluster NAD(P)-dependent oxidoreductase [Corallincola platygyrae]|uniref:Hybrid-cluster NAD(P)-dependent oxidoreductase n=1 Tax=Corallincola platygyrae TaxID=1193278 RepID=A0ABW4XQ33_9GAMM